MTPLLQIENLSTHFYIDEGMVQAVRNVNLHIQKGETLALVCFSVWEKMSDPSNTILPPAYFPGGVGTRRMMLRAVTDLPHPDSPTSTRTNCPAA